MNPAPYNPLDYSNLTASCVRELMIRGPWPLADVVDAPFEGAGVYALFYVGQSPKYAEHRSPKASAPIYVGKAVPTGARKGSGVTDGGRSLHGRLREHAASISQVPSLELADFRCRYLVVTELWIVMCERFLIEHYRPVWNLCLDGFGNHDPGSGRQHPGRPWAAKLTQTRTRKQALNRLATFVR